MRALRRPNLLTDSSNRGDPTAVTSIRLPTGCRASRNECTLRRDDRTLRAPLTDRASRMLNYAAVRCLDSRKISYQELGPRNASDREPRRHALANYNFLPRQGIRYRLKADEQTVVSPNAYPKGHAILVSDRLLS